MFYYASKIGWFFATPSNLLVSLILLGLLIGLAPRWRRAGWILAFGSVLATMALGFLPVANYLLVPLEQRFPAFRDDGGPVSGIILLGGAVDSSDSAALGQIIANESAERVLDTMRLAARYPEARILISGGGGHVFGEGVAEAPIIATFLGETGIDPRRITVEDRSRTTFENAVYSRELVAPKPGERWLLVTSAWHMPRAIGVFRKAGFPVTPYPVDYRTGGPGEASKPFAFISDGLRRLDVATKEWVGLIGYHYTGRTSALFPAPQAP
jgi:uncharacterized SAM-binding protein YcdF (DUF218 family)